MVIIQRANVNVVHPNLSVGEVGVELLHVDGHVVPDHLQALVHSHDTVLVI